jgi:hypothetical protein
MAWECRVVQFYKAGLYMPTANVGIEPCVPCNGSGEHLYETWVPDKSTRADPDYCAGCLTHCNNLEVHHKNCFPEVKWNTEETDTPVKEKVKG